LPFLTNRITIGLQIRKICLHPVTFSLRFFKSDRLLDRNFQIVYQPGFTQSGRSQDHHVFIFPA
jgi:hypothetical protein